MASTSSSTLRQELVANFGDATDVELIDECVDLCQNYNLAADRLFYKWEAIKFGSKAPIQFSRDSIAILKQNIQRDIEKEKSKKNSLKTTQRFGLPTRNMIPMTGVLRNRAAPSINPFGTRAKVTKSTGEVGDLGSPLRIAKAEIQLTKVAFDEIATSTKFVDLESKPQPSKYMYEKITERSEILDDQIEEIAQVVKDHYGIPEFGDPSASSDEDVFVIGRIILDVDSSQSVTAVKLNEASISLESSRAIGSGARISLKFNTGLRIIGSKRGGTTPSLGIFPGAIVCLKGRNGGGGWFLASEYYTIPALSSRPRDEASDHNTREPFTMFIASGPFTTETDLKYKLWYTLMSRIKSELPDVVLLVGPFVDSNHSEIRLGEIDASPSQLFQTTFVDHLKDYLEFKPGGAVLIVPNVRDLMSDHHTYPQPGFSRNLTDGDSRIRLLSNPSQFMLNNYNFAVNSVDVLFHLRKEEFVKRGVGVESPLGSEASPAGAAQNQAEDSMINLCRHLLEQRSFYPIFPVPVDLMHEVNLDVTRSGGLKIGAGVSNGQLEREQKYAPDFLIVPSRLKHFVKNFDQTVAINPSFLTKNTFVEVTCSGSGPPVVEVRKLE